MEGANSINLTKTVSTSDEGISFDIPRNDPKVAAVNYLRWWEAYDTDTNQRVNYGPIRTINSGGDVLRITGPGRSALLEDYIKSIQTFYYPIDRFIDDLRYENFSAQPLTSTIIKVDTDSEYYGLSKRSKDNAIDEQTGYIAIGRDTPERGIKRTDSFWSGTGKSDYLIVDLGDTFKVSKAKIQLPWWGGATDNHNRVYDWRLLTSQDNSSYSEQFNAVNGLMGLSLIPRVFTDGQVVYWGENGFEFWQSTADPDNPIEARYFKIDISNVYARYNHNDATTNLYRTDEWDWECGGSNIFDGESRPSPSVATGDLIDKDVIVPSSDCHASVVEVGVYRKIINRDFIAKTPYHQIDGTSEQVTFYHNAAPEETFAAGSARKFEPGGFFRKVHISTGSSVTVEDEYNVVLHQGGSGSFICPAYTKMIKITGNDSARVTYADTWPTVLEAYSYGGSYSFTEIQNDYVLLDFRGVSLKWYATVPADKTPGTVSIELRQKDENGVWGAWDTLEAAFTLPGDIAGEKIWEITYESGQLDYNISYQLRITNLDGNFVSVDSFAGYWSATYIQYNEDHERMELRHRTDITQLYDLRYGEGSIYKLDNESFGLQSWISFSFEGDRLIVFSRKGPGYGILKIGPIGGIPVPGGDADGGYQINLEHPYDIPAAVVFDTNDLFDDPYDGLPWGYYTVFINQVGQTDVVWFEGIGVHETSGLSVKFLDTTYLDILKSVTEAIQLEWDITENGLLVLPRLGEDKEVIFAEGRGTTIKVDNVEDIGQVASMLVASGADIDGLPLTAVVENKINRQILNRTIQRQFEMRNIGDYFTLIGAARAELIKRRRPERRITISTTDLRGIVHGDSFIVNDPRYTGRVRAMSIDRRQSVNEGTEYTIECAIWPQII